MDMGSGKSQEGGVSDQTCEYWFTSDFWKQEEAILVSKSHLFTRATQINKSALRVQFFPPLTVAHRERRQIF